ncbi:MAG: CoB--CoM heterodisulfide reductase iron-sulfur subunit B family protein [Anaerolineales bacterium]|nr:MAG: CoB--CoM heterodisulfide reductase iron-sulfur subunit B family protein [Anaerolineales bacterium]
MNYCLYPGCSLHSTGLEYGLSSRAVLKHLEFEINELEAWNCCGASSAHALSHTLGLALPARVIALAQSAGGDLIVPCAACFNRLKGADHTLRTDQAQRIQIQSLVGFEYREGLSIRPLLAVLYEDYGLQKITAQVKIPLNGLRVVAYYGCLLLRPPEITRFDDPDHPQVMAALLTALGAEVQPWSYATECCGAGLSLSRADIVQKLVGRLAERACEAGAEALVTACPLCQVNLEMRQTCAPKLPAFYFTELLGLAFDLPQAESWWPKHLIDPRPLLSSLGLYRIPEPVQYFQPDMF